MLLLVNLTQNLMLVQFRKNFFRVIDSTGFCNTDGIKSYRNRTPNKLFYDSKEQYIEHRLKLLDND